MRRPLVTLGLVAALLTASTGQAAAADTRLYLRGDGEPKASMSTAALPSISLPDYDGEGPGRLVQKDSGGSGQSDPVKYQQWSYDVSGQTLSVGKLQIWGAAKDFKDDKRVVFRGYVMDCASSCTVLAQDTVEIEDEGGWELRALDLGTSTRSFGDGHSLVVKLVVHNESDDDMWFAYGTQTFDAHLAVTFSTPATTSTAPTTTTTTAPTTTSTTVPTTTSTTSPQATTTTRASTTAGDSATTTTTPDANSTIATEGDADPLQTSLATSSTPPPSAGSQEEQPPPKAAESMVVRFAAGEERPSDMFSTSRNLRPEEGLMVAFSTIAETITLYWQAAVGLGSVAAGLLWFGLSSKERRDEEDLVP